MKGHHMYHGSFIAWGYRGNGSVIQDGSTPISSRDRLSRSDRNGKQCCGQPVPLQETRITGKADSTALFQMPRTDPALLI